jgi:hypothetical protein
MTFFNLRANGDGQAKRILQMYGGQQIIHGHTPIHYMNPGLKPATIREPLVYNHDLCLNVDGAICLGGTGFAYRLPL